MCLSCKLTQIVFATCLCSPDGREIGSEIKLSFDDFAKSHLSNETDVRILATQTGVNGKCFRHQCSSAFDTGHLDEASLQIFEIIL
jgi:hypothetical protein